MAQSNVSKARDFRGETIALLKLFAEPGLQQDLAEDLPLEQVPGALCRLWFDEIYVPSVRYFDCPKGDLDRSLVRLYLSEFTVEEREALERFHGCLELRLELLRKSETDLFASDLWQNICKDAGNALYFLRRMP